MTLMRFVSVLMETRESEITSCMCSKARHNSGELTQAHTDFRYTRKTHRLLCNHFNIEEPKFYEHAKNISYVLY